MSPRPIRPRHLAGFVAAAVLALAPLPRAEAQQQQIGALVSPGPLSKAHTKLEGLANCQKCHEPGKKVTAQRCLACHKPVAERIEARKGVHRNVTNDCVSCHSEHAGTDAELRPLNRKSFNHAEETGFPLDGKHAAIATDCAKCHKARSFLGLRPDCASCHEDLHRGALGAACAACHSTTVAFRETAAAFDHTKTAFPLSEAHRTVACTKCHVNKVFKGLKFAVCTDCHTDPHRQQFGAACASCHGGPTWKTDKVEHARTGFSLVGRHAAVQCASCHKQPPMRAKLEFARCASCHSDPHRGEFPQDCAACHTTTGFRQTGFDHLAKTKFALTGRHAEVPCASCHKGASTAAAPGANLPVDFRGLKTACATCHADTHAGKLGTQCASCHDTRSFRVASFKHTGPPEFYGGQHASVACGKCHGGEGIGKAGLTGKPASQRVFRGLSTECASCHRDVHLGQLGAKCQTCHSINAAKFAAVGFSHAQTRFELTGKHATVECSKCHTSEARSYPGGSGTAIRYADLSTQCQSCHKDVHLGQLGTRCESCHTPTAFKLATYNHRGDESFHIAKHATAPCQACHKSQDGDYPAGRGVAVQYAALSAACAACHKDVHQGTLGTRCESCHTPHQWPGASRAFHKATIFPLEGQHLAVPCERCHLSGQTKGTPNRCYDCHWIRRQDDRFRTLLGSDCAQCHNPTSWRFVDWDHAAVTGFELAGAHRSLDCQTCHRDVQFLAGTPTACYSCHQTDFTSAKNPNHLAAGFPNTCDTCHNRSSTTWTGVAFNHAATAFPLLGVHATQPCSTCHGDGVYKGKSVACVSCHQTNFNNSKNPSHVASGFPTTCDSCHKVSDTSWTQATFNHAATAFPLLGVHATQPCSTCHGDGVYKGKSVACVSCHQTDFNNSKNPNHVAAGFPTTCDSCHKVSDPTWTQASFNHATVFSLAGVHATTPCANCHVNNNYSTVPTTCVGCHLSTYQTATAPVNHAGLPTTCDSCHNFSDAAWTLASSFRHATYFPLAGAHTTAPCASCHTNGNFTSVPTSPCYACHTTDYQNAASPVNHIAVGFPTTCDTCHRFSDTSWTQGVFNHATVFPLAGVHATTPCANCHVNNNYSTVPTTCVGCHLSTYQTATAPVNHAGLPTTCDSCHNFSDAAWTLASSFRHATYFPLAGAHTTAPCASCHTNGNFTSVPTSPCYACHATDYQNAVSPVNHIAAGFPTTCDTCHKFSDTSWTQAVFSHTWFPMNHDSAGGVCATCHTNPSSYAVFSCTTGCHPSGDTNARHTQVQGYIYNSSACYSCHPTGRNN